MRQHSSIDIFIIGFALFSMFFGAGNVIFPPFLGMSAGSEWVNGFICYYLADIGLALLALFSMYKKGGSDPIVNPIGRIPATILMCAIVLCIGPMLAIPRTAAMTFETSVQPFTSIIGSVGFSVIFFGLVFLCCIRENSVVDIVGKIFTPLLLLGLLILIVKGFMSPLGDFAELPKIDNVAENGIKVGYQTMDVLATMLFGVLILKTTEAKGYIKPSEKCNIAIKSSIVAGILLFVVYGGLTYLGATVSTQFDLSVSRTSLMLSIVSSLLGQQGSLLFAIVVALACITTAVGLVSSCAEYFAKLFNNKISYQALVIIICVFSAIVSNVGIEQLVSIASPILDIIYPPTLVLIALSFVPNVPNLAYRLSVLAALVISVLTAAVVYANISLPFLDSLPLTSLGFGWIIPAIIFGVIGYAISKFGMAKNTVND